MNAAGDTEQWKIGKKLEPVLRRYLPIVIRGKEELGVKFWGFGKEIYLQLLSYLTDLDYGDIIDVKLGKDILIEYVSPKDAGNTYGKTSIKIKPKNCPLTTDTTLLKKLLTLQENLLDIYKGVYGHTYEVLDKALNKYLNPGTAAAETVKELKETPSKVDDYKKDEKTIELTLALIDAVLTAK